MLPAGWTTAKLPDLIGHDGVFADGDWIETKDQDPGGDVRLVQLADVGDGVFRDRSRRFLTSIKAAEMNCTFLQRGDVLIARMPDPLGRACIFPGDSRKSVTAVDVCIVRPGADSVDLRWLMWTINAPQFRRAIAEMQSGTTRGRISRKNLGRIPLPVPPIAEQRRIIAAIGEHFSRIDAGVEALQRARRNLQRMRAAVVQAALAGRLVPQDPVAEPIELGLKQIIAERKSGFHAKGKAEDGDSLTTNAAYDHQLPRGWTWATGEQLFRWASGKNLPRTSQVKGEIPVYGGNGLSGVHSKALVGRPTLIVGRVGAHCGNVHVTDGPAWVTDNAIYATFISSGLDLWYARLALTSSRLRSRAAGSGQPFVNQRLLNETRIPLPPLHEQKLIVERVDQMTSVIEGLDREIDRSISHSSALRRTILAQASEGHLVSQDPSDEPGAVLLERSGLARTANGPKQHRPRRPSR